MDVAIQQKHSEMTAFLMEQGSKVREFEMNHVYLACSGICHHYRKLCYFTGGGGGINNNFNKTFVSFTCFQILFRYCCSVSNFSKFHMNTLSLKM